MSARLRRGPTRALAGVIAVLALILAGSAWAQARRAGGGGDPFSTTTTLTTAPNPSVVGQSVTLTASVTTSNADCAIPSNCPTGSVVIKDYATTIANFTLPGHGVSQTVMTTFMFSSTAYHVLTAVYGGDLDETNGSSTSTRVFQLVKANTTTAVATAPNPSSVGQTVTVTATVASASPGATPMGTVACTSPGATITGSGTLTAGVATFTTTTLPLGAGTITCTYGGDMMNFNASIGTATQMVVAATTTTTTAVATAPNPSIFGQTVSITVPAGVPALRAPAGTVNCTSPRASFSSTNLPLGAEVITCTYTPSSGAFQTSAGTATQMVAASPTPTATPSASSTPTATPTPLPTATSSPTSAAAPTTTAAAAPTGPSQSYKVGWNLVAGPTGQTFPQASGPLYTYQAADTVYQMIGSTSGVTANYGYWAYFPTATAVPINGGGSPNALIALPAGHYVLVGNASTQSVSAQGADQLLSFDPAANQCVAVTTLGPGQGAWAYSIAGVDSVLKLTHFPA